MNKEQLELFTDYLLSTLGFLPQITQTECRLGQGTCGPCRDPEQSCICCSVCLFQSGMPEDKRHINHLSLRSHLYLKAIRNAYEELQALKSA